MSKPAQPCAEEGRDFQRSSRIDRPLGSPQVLRGVAPENPELKEGWEKARKELEAANEPKRRATTVAFENAVVESLRRGYGPAASIRPVKQGSNDSRPGATDVPGLTKDDPKPDGVGGLRLQGGIGDWGRLWIEAKCGGTTYTMRSNGEQFRRHFATMRRLKPNGPLVYWIVKTSDITIGDDVAVAAREAGIGLIVSEVSLAKDGSGNISVNDPTVIVAPGDTTAGWTNIGSSASVPLTPGGGKK